MPKTHAPKLPNFIVAGAPKSGTTSLYYYLCQHPQIYMSPVKEPTFFGAADLLSRDELRVKTKDELAELRTYLSGDLSKPREYFLVTEWDDYIKLFKNVRDEIAIGEASVSYIWLPSAAPAIRSKLPGARLIFLLRDPTERLFSLYLLRIRREPTLTFRSWVLKAMHSGGDRRHEVHRYPIALDGGLYATQLARFLDIFPRDQVRVYLYEAYRADGRAVLRDIFAFLGVDPDQPIDVSCRHNETVVPRFPAIDELRHRILGNASLTGWLPVRVSHALREFYNRRRGNFTLDPEDRRLVIDYYRDEILRTQDLIGRDLAGWLR